jgi:hypothetical protein
MNHGRRAAGPDREPLKVDALNETHWVRLLVVVLADSGRITRYSEGVQLF